MRYIVSCQDALGHRLDVPVHASTDEKACATALRTLNSWKALHALPTKAEAPEAPARRIEATTQTEQNVEHAVADEQHSIGRIIYRETVREAVTQRRGPLGSLGHAIKRANER